MPDSNRDPSTEAAPQHASENAPLLPHSGAGRGSPDTDTGEFEDSAQLLALGHKPELERNHTKLSMLGLAFAILNSWTALSASLSIALPSGGPSAAVWGLVVAGICNLCLAASLAEFLSAYPTAGGQYHWVAMISPPEWVPILSWICGWINCSGWVFLVATGGSLASQLILGIMSLLDPGFEPTPYQMILIYVLFTITGFVINTFWNRLLPLFTKCAFLWSVLGVVVISITLLTTAAPNYQSPEFVFRKFINETGWPNGIAWSLGLLQGSLALTGYDAVAHMIEEIPHAAREGPKIMVYAVIVGVVTGFIFLVVLLFCMGDIEEVISAPCGPILAIFYQATKSKAGSICLLMFPLICLLFGATTIMTTASRMIYAFARDNGLPFSSTFSSVHPTLHVPLNALLLTNVVVLFMSGLYLISVSSLNAFLSASVVALCLSYGFPVLINVLTGRRKLPKDRGFKLEGWKGWVANCVGLAFTVGAAGLFVLPPKIPVERSNMNYSPLVFLCVLVISTVAYIFEGRKSFTGPIVEVPEVVQGRPLPGHSTEVSALLGELDEDYDEDEDEDEDAAVTVSSGC